MTRENAIRKVKSLLRMAADPHAAAGEIRNAKRLAAKLILKYGFTDDDLAGKDVAKKVDPKRPQAWCGNCAKYRNFSGVECDVCRRSIWELCAKINGVGVRTTKADYGRLNRHCEPIGNGRRLKG